MQQCVCVYSSSSAAVAPMFFAAAEELGALLARRNDTLVFGGSSVGLMGATAQAAQAHGGRVIGVIPQVIHEMGIAYEQADELIVTRDLRERKAVMEARADLFVALPGGFGTLEELLEILTLKQLQVHNKPVIFVNVAGFYNPLIELFEHIYDHKFAKAEHRALYYVAPNVEDVFRYADLYEPVPYGNKWF